jgi:hypothetical protein
MGYKELIASPLTVVLGPDEDAYVSANSGVAQVQVGISAVTDASQPVTATLPSTWQTLTPASAGQSLYYWSRATSQASTGFYRVYSRATDAAGNAETEAPDWYEGAFVVDNTAPTVTWTKTPPSTTGAAAVLAGAQASGTVSTGTGTRDDVAQTYFRVAGPSGTSSYPAEEGRAWIPLPAAGAYTVSAIAIDEAGNQGQQTTPVTVSATDSVATITEPSGTAVSGTSVLVWGYVRFTGSGDTRVTVGVSGGGTVEANLDTPGAAFGAWTAVITLPGGEGAKIVGATPILNGVASPFTILNLTLDETAPALNVTGPAAGASGTRTLTFTGTATDAGSRVAGVEVSVDGGYTWRQASLSGTTWSVNWTLNWNMDSYQDYVSYPAQVRATDRAGNVTLVDWPVIVDNVPPANLLPVTLSQPEGQHVARDTDLTISWNTPADPAGAVQVLWAVDQVADTTPSTVASGSSATASLNAVGDWYVHLAAEDPAGNQTLIHYGPWHVRFLGTGAAFPQSRESIILDGLISARVFRFLVLLSKFFL